MLNALDLLMDIYPHEVTRSVTFEPVMMRLLYASAYDR